LHDLEALVAESEATHGSVGTLVAAPPPESNLGDFGLGIEPTSALDPALTASVDVAGTVSMIDFTAELWDPDLTVINAAEQTTAKPSLSSDNGAELIPLPQAAPLRVVNCSCVAPHTPIVSHWSNVTIVPGPYLIYHMPDPYANTLRIQRICVVEAMRANCYAVGITERMFCSDDSISPFYRPHIDKSADGENVISSVQSIFRTVQNDLRPSRKQITKNHHPYIDVFPFPEARENLLDKDEEIDGDEFFQDALKGLYAGADDKSLRETQPALALERHGT
jgi:hypothetical protein